MTKTENIFAGDPPLADFLDWLGYRLTNVYGESENVDFVQACHRHASEIRAFLEQDVMEKHSK